MIPIQVISLAKGAERRICMTAQLDGLGLPFQFLGGVDGTPLSEQARAPLRQSHLTGGEIGCALSHFAVIRMIVDGPHPFAAVSEDDVVIRPEFPQFLAILERDPPPLDVMWLSQAVPKKHRRSCPSANWPAGRSGRGSIPTTRQRLRSTPARPSAGSPAISGRSWPYRSHAVVQP